MSSAAIEPRKRQRKAQRQHVLALFLLGGGLFLLGVVALLVLPKTNPRAAVEERQLGAPAEVSFPAPDLRLSDLQGNEVALSGYLGQVVLVNNFATWCPPCRAEMPILEAFYQAHQDQGFTLIGIEAGEPAEEVQDFVASYAITFPVWLDPGQEALQAFRNPALPSSYVIDREGSVRLVWSGAVTGAALEKYVTPMLEN
jgi:peroxiredoxin